MIEKGAKYTKINKAGIRLEKIHPLHLNNDRNLNLTEESFGGNQVSKSVFCTVIYFQRRDTHSVEALMPSIIRPSVDYLSLQMVETLGFR